MEDKHLSKNEFVREKIKNKPANHKRIWRQACVYALNGTMFALAMSVVFLLMIPIVRQRWETANTPGIQNSETETAGTQETQIWDNTQSQPESFSIEDYQRIQTQLYEIGNQWNKSIVTITGVVSNKDWFDKSYEWEGEGSGTIIADQDEKLWILTEKKVIKTASSIHVTFADGTVVPAEMVKYDGNTGLAILTVGKSELEYNTLSAIQVMEMGDTSMVHKGSVVIALGSPAGMNYSILTGCVTATGNEISTQDCNYSVYTTDIAAVRNGSGIIINPNGQLIGVMMQDFSADSENSLTAVNISELKPVMDLLFAGADVPYFGMYVSTVAEQTADKHGIPRGVYVKEVAMDSPAMDAGVQSGDIITSVAGEKVASVEQYNQVLLGLTPGETYSVVIRREGADGYKKITCKTRAGVLQ